MGIRLHLSTGGIGLLYSHIGLHSITTGRRANVVTLSHSEDLEASCSLPPFISHPKQVKSACGIRIQGVAKK